MILRTAKIQLLLQPKIFPLKKIIFSVALSKKKLPLTWWRLGAGGASTAARTGAKLTNSHKLSGEPLPRLRQTARYRQCFPFPLFPF
jgi:hypothetical protein